MVADLLYIGSTLLALILLVGCVVGGLMLGYQKMRETTAAREYYERKNSEEAP
jgi:hypothetical protein